MDGVALCDKFDDSNKFNKLSKWKETVKSRYIFEIIYHAFGVQIVMSTLSAGPDPAVMKPQYTPVCDVAAFVLILGIEDRPTSLGEMVVESFSIM